VIACSRHSQQVPENAGKHRNSGFLLRLVKAISNFLYSPIVNSGAQYQISQSQQLSETRLPAIRHKCDSIPAHNTSNATLATLSGHMIRLTIYNATLTATA
jgi:hypothetical protein